MNSTGSILRRAALLASFAALAPAVALAAPSTQITGGPATGAYTKDATPTFTFTSSEPGTFECKLGAAGWSSCFSPKTLPAIGDGVHTFSVRAVDGFKNADASPAARTFMVDTQAPVVGIAGSPTGIFTNDTTPSLAFLANDDNSLSRECSVGDGKWTACESPYTTPVLADGWHTFSLRVIDASGNVTAADRAVHVDTVAAIAQITVEPTGNPSRPKFGFSVPAEADIFTFTCKLDDLSAFACNGGQLAAYFTPDTPLADGVHTFSVKARDSAGNEQPVATTVTFTIGTPVTPPVAPPGPDGPAPAAGAPAPLVAAGAPAASTPPALVAAPRPIATRRAARKTACSRKAVERLRTKQARKTAAKRCAAKKGKKAKRPRRRA